MKEPPNPYEDPSNSYGQVSPKDRPALIHKSKITRLGVAIFVIIIFILGNQVSRKLSLKSPQEDW
ncbi:hypothetical protein N9Z53_01835 [Mariniblastus sp.]|nr:hypothetical protein [bacterium]MDA7925262.1 hypothetical protein [Mariniblastus sp.]MDB4368078.1 hypothetical protein [Mariniblastus sp.]MDB4372493.1 hypothetical protein [Mariniblastus sp.]